MERSMSEEVADPDFRPIDRSQHLLLVIDDKPARLDATVRQLRHAGFSTCEASSGAAGLAAAGDAISAIVVDVQLPDMDGVELCRQLRSRPQTARLPVLQLTAAPLTDDAKLRGRDSGADACLTRPVEPAVLVATVQALVRTRAAEEGMRHSEAKFRAIYAQAPSGIGLLDASGRFVDANPALLRLLGRDAPALLGRTIAELVPASASARARRFGQCIGDGGDQGDSAEFAVLDPQGRLVHLQWSLSRAIEPGIDMVVVNDVSQRVLLEQQRLKLLERERVARSEAERVGRTKDDFIAVLSHELRTPLNAIMQWAHVLLKRGGTPEQMRGFAAIERNVKLQARMIADLLDMSQLNVGKLPLLLESIDPAALLRSALQALQQSADENENRLIVDIAGSYRPIRVDAARLQQVIWNLLSNAIKFSSRGGRIWVVLEQDGAGLSLGVRDEGQGMAAEFVPLAFDRFAQSHAAGRRGRGGLGLGLAIAKQLVEAHGGTISAYSAGPGRGASFVVRLPAEAQLPQGLRPRADSGAANADPGEAVETRLNGLRLLIVEDDREAGAMLQLILRERGAEVELARDAATALALAERWRPDLLISDIGLPDQDGYALIRGLRRREAQAQPQAPRLPAIALTAFTRPQDREQALAAGFDRHCGKPLRPLQLIQMVHQLLPQR
jgi:PAS domain S-box-containing protein